MWNSPHKLSDHGKRYELAHLSAFIQPIDEMLYLSKSTPVADIVDEGILKRLERDEFIYALFQVVQALLEDVEIPEGGHTGIQEAMVAELLNKSYVTVCCEMDLADLDDEPEGYWAREAAWNSVDRLLIHRFPNAPELPDILQETGLELSDHQPYQSEKLTLEIWEELLIGEGGLFGEFLWDIDWRMDHLMDLPPDAADEASQTLGLNLDIVQALPHTPNNGQLQMAEQYISDVIRKSNEIQEKSNSQ